MQKKAKELQEAITRLEQFEIKTSVSLQQIENYHHFEGEKMKIELKKELVEKQVLSSENGKILFNLESGTFIIKKSQ